MRYTAENRKIYIVQYWLTIVQIKIVTIQMQVSMHAVICYQTAFSYITVRPTAFSVMQVAICITFFHGVKKPISEKNRSI